ncbi:MAG TPA: hypothetical protein VIJ21_09200 [Solirubrobacterales bacterium]
MFSLVLVLLVVASTALANPVTPKGGVFSGTAEAAGAPGAGNATFKVTKSGQKVGVEVTLAISLTCKYNGQPIPLPTTLSSASFKQNGNGAPLAVKDGKFSYKGPIYGFSASSGKAEVSGTFKSPTKVVGTASFSWSTVELVAGRSGPCESGKLTLAGLHP